MINTECSPKQASYSMPAEWEHQSAIFLSWPLNPVTWVGVREKMEKDYAAFAAAITRYEKLYINCVSAELSRVKDLLANANAVMDRITFLDIPTNDAWCRDHGPVFLRNPNGQCAIAKFVYNAWGAKFSPWDLDDAVPYHIGKTLDCPVFPIDLICEGGALESNGEGFLLTTENVILNPNRNPGLTKERAEEILKEALGMTAVGWLKSGLIGDDTDGHIDTLARFFRNDAVLAAVDKKGGIQHDVLEQNFMDLCKMRLPSGSRLTVVPLPCPEPLYSPKGEILPANYANYLPVNGAVLVPSYRQDKADAQAAAIIGEAYPGRDIVLLDCCEILHEGGALHCLSQQGY